MATVRLDGTSTVPQPLAAGSVATADPVVVVDHGGTARVFSKHRDHLAAVVFVGQKKEEVTQ